MRKRIRSYKKSGRKKEQMSLKDILLLATAALNFISMIYKIVQDWLG